MKRSLIHTQILSVALAIFAMLFGSGNIVFPLSLGRDTGSMALYAMLGFFATAVLVPLIGIITMVMFDGDYKAFFQKMGTRTGSIVMLLCMVLMGPFCVIPRSISIAFASMNWVFPSLDLRFFSLISVILLYLLTARQSGLLVILGRVLGPLKLLLLSAVIVKGFFVPSQSSVCASTGWQVFARGFTDGYGTLDLIGVIFFTSIILVGLRAHQAAYKLSDKQVLGIMVKGGTLGALLLGVVYAGFVLVSSFHAGEPTCVAAAHDKLLSVLAGILLGDGGGVLASITVAVACLTTALALTTVFAQYVQKDLFPRAVSYHQALIVTLLIALFFANQGFQGIMSFVFPIISVLYPALLAVCIANIVYKTTRVDLARPVFYGMLLITLWAHRMDMWSQIKAWRGMSPNSVESVLDTTIDMDMIIEPEHAS